MTKTDVKKGESIDDALRRFKRNVSKTGVLKEARNRSHYEKPSEKRKKQAKEARRRNQKNQRR